MAKGLWQSVRLSLLVIMLGGFLGVLGRAIATPKTEKSTETAQFPATVSVQDWQPVSSIPLKQSDSSPAGQEYQYRQGDRLLKIQMRYMEGDGNVSRFLFVYTPIRAANANLQIRYHPHFGAYGVLTHRGQTYLSACINPRGKSTVTEQQFAQNRYTHDLKLDRILPWVLSQQPLLNRHCLWTFMSTPVANQQANSTPSEATYDTLETVWFSWYQWWQPNFSPS